MKKFLEKKFSRKNIREANDKNTLILAESTDRKVEDFYKYYAKYPSKWQQIKLDNSERKLRIFDAKEDIYEKTINKKVTEIFAHSKIEELSKWAEELTQRTRNLRAQKVQLEENEKYLTYWEDDINRRLSNLDKYLEALEKKITENNHAAYNHVQQKKQYIQENKEKLYNSILEGYRQNGLLIEEVKKATSLDYDKIIDKEIDRYSKKENIWKKTKKEHEEAQVIHDRELTLFATIYDRYKKAWEQEIGLSRIEIKKVTDILSKVTDSIQEANKIREADNKERNRQTELIMKNYENYCPKIDGELPKKAKERKKEVDKVISEANGIVLHWIQVGEIGKTINQFKIDIEKLEFRDAAYRFGENKEDIQRKAEVRSRIGTLLQMDVKVSEIQDLLNTWGFLGQFRPGDGAVSSEERAIRRINPGSSEISQNNSYSILQDQRTERKKREMFFQNIRKEAKNFGEKKRKWEIADKDAKRTFKVILEDIRYNIKNYVLSEIDRIGGKAIHFDFDRSNIGKACELPDED